MIDALFRGPLAEQITYDKGSGSTRTVSALVVRQPPAPTGEAPSVSRVEFRVTVPANAVYGILASEFDTGDHKLWIARARGGTPEAWSGWRLATQTASAVTLEK